MKEAQLKCGPYVDRRRVEFFTDKRGDWRWRIRHKNGKIIAESGEGYKRYAAVNTAWARLLAWVAYTPEPALQIRGGA